MRNMDFEKDTSKIGIKFGKSFFIIKGFVDLISQI
jgi:hypothetical protein